MRSPTSGPTIRFGGYEADVAAGELRKGDRRIPLQEQPFQVLTALLERPGEVVSREYLRERLWPGQPFVDFDQGLNTAINKLRDALGDSAASPRFVETVPRRGYRFTFPIDPAPVKDQQVMSAKEWFLATVWKRRQWAVWLAAGAVIVLSLGVVRWGFRPSPPQLPLRRFTLRAPAGNIQPVVLNRSTSISPDGKRIAFINNGEGGTRRLWIQHLEKEEPVLTRGSDGAADPFWSPDSQFVGFALPYEGKLMRMPVEGGAATEICRVPGGLFAGGAWSPDGSTIVFGSGNPHILYEVAAIGGAPRVAVSRESLIKVMPTESESALGYLHRPQFLPLARRRVIVFGFGWADAKMVLRDLDSGKTELLGPGRLPTYSPTGHLVFQAVTGLPDLWAYPFSLDRLKTTGPAFLVGRNGTDPSVAADGTLVYVDHSSVRLVWVNRRGEHVGDVGSPMLGIFYPALSPDGRRVAFEGRETDNLDIWVQDLSAGTRTRLSTDPSTEVLPAWSPDSETVAYSSWRTGLPSMFVRQADGGGPEQPLEKGLQPARVADWSRNGLYIAYDMQNVPQKLDTRVDPASLKGGSDVWYLQRSSGKGWERHPFIKTTSWTRSPKFSPDGRYVAYLSNESGRDELYVTRFPAGGRRWTVSNNGALQPRWSPNSRELFYVERDTLMAVPVRTTPEFSAKAPVPLFAHPGFGSSWDPNYDVAAGGDRFLVPEDITGPNNKRLIHVVQNWIAGVPNRR